MARPVSLTTLFPRPRPVTLAGRTFLVGEMRLRDLIDLQAWIDSRWESPLDAVRPSLEPMGERERMDALRGLWDACEAGPPMWGTDEAMRILNCPEGIAETFYVVLRTHQPEMTLIQLREVAESTTPEEYMAMLTAWRRVDPIDELAWMLGMDDAGKGNPIGWAQAVCEMCETYGWTLEYAESLTLRQISTARGCGKPKERGIAVAPKTNLRETVRAMRARMNGHSANGKGGSDGG